MRNKSLALLITLVGSVVLIGQLRAEIQCRSDVSFKWKQAGGDSLQDTPWGSVQAKGTDEAAAKSKLAESVLRQRQKAAEYCRRQHENLSGCVSAKYATSTSVLQNLDFSARKSIQDAITSDCKASQGTCAETSASEVSCAEVVVPGEKKDEPAAAAKDDKGAKKKK